MSQPRSKYDWPGLPLFDREGNPVGVGDTMEGAYGQRCEIVEWEGAIGYRSDVWPLTLFPLTASRKESFRENWKLVMPPGFPKDRRIDPSAPVYRFVDETHAVRQPDRHAFRVLVPCTNARYWTHDGDGNPVQAVVETQPEEVLQPATQSEINGLLQRQIDELESRLDALEQRQMQVTWQTSTAKANAEAQRVEVKRSKNNSGQWWMVLNPYPAGHKPKYQHPTQSSAEAEAIRIAKAQGHKVHVLELVGTAHPDGFQVRRVDPARDVECPFCDQRFTVPGQPDPDRELRDWFWENRERILIEEIEGKWSAWFRVESLACKKWPVAWSRLSATNALRALRRMVEEAERSGQEGGR